MKINTITLAIVFLSVLSNCTNQSATNNLTEIKEQDSTATQSFQLKSNPYNDLRNMALTVTPDKLKLSLANDKTLVFGVVMDFGVDGGTATIVTYQTGDASMYTSNGGGIIGGGQHSTVNKASKLFVAKAQQYLDKSIKTDETPLPENGFVTFYLLTNKGIFTTAEKFKTDTDNSSSIWNDLFIEGNKVITELRLIEEKK